MTGTPLGNARTIVAENDMYTGMFHYKPAFIAYIVHVLHLFFGPLSLLAMKKVVGEEMLWNMELGRRKMYLTDFLFHLYTLGLVPFLLFQEDRSEVLLEASYGLAIMMLRYLGMFVKYGTLTQKQWESLTTRKLTDEESKPLRIWNWSHLDKNTAVEEIRYAFSRVPVNVLSLQLMFLQPLPESLRIELESGAENSDVEVKLDTLEIKIPALTAAEYIVEQLCTPSDPFWLHFCSLAGGVFCVMPLSFRWYLFGFSSWVESPAQICFSFCTIVLCWVISSGFLRFIVVGIIDLQRKLRLMRECIAISSWLDSQSFLPKLDFSSSQTVLGLYYMRRSFLEFGARYSRRVHLYTALMLPVSVLIILFIVLQATKLVSSNYNLMLVPALFLSIASDVVLCKMVLMAVKVNKTFPVQRDLLLEAIARIKQQRRPETLLAAIKRLHWAERKLEQDQGLRPLKILGVTISEGFVNKLGALAISGVFALIKLNS